jgi:hypothetical protein
MLDALIAAASEELENLEPIVETEGEKEYKKIKALLESKAFQLATDYIKQKKDNFFAYQLYEVVISARWPAAWLAFISNPVLVDAIDSQELIYLINRTITAICNLGNDTSQPELFQIGMAIAQNPILCKRISYSRLIPLMEHDPHLENYIMTNANFLLHLDHRAISEMALSAADRAPILTNTLFSILCQHQPDEIPHCFAVLALQWLFTRSTPAREIIWKEKPFHKVLALEDVVLADATTFPFYHEIRVLESIKAVPVSAKTQVSLAAENVLDLLELQLPYTPLKDMQNVIMGSEKKEEKGAEKGHSSSPTLPKPPL